MTLLVKQKEAATAAAIKDGTYRATLSNIKQFVNTYGERIGFEFTIQGGQFDGERVMRSTAPQLTKQSKLAEVIEGNLAIYALQSPMDADQSEIEKCWEESQSATLTSEKQQIVIGACQALEKAFQLNYGTKASPGSAAV